MGSPVLMPQAHSKPHGLHQMLSNKITYLITESYDFNFYAIIFFQVKYLRSYSYVERKFSDYEINLKIFQILTEIKCGIIIRTIFSYL